MYVEVHNKLDSKNRTVRKCCVLSAVSLFLLGKETYLDSQDWTTFSENPYINFLMKTAVYQVFFLHTPKETCSTGRSPKLIQSFSQPWFLLYFFFLSLILFVAQTQLIARKGAVKRKYIPIGTIFISFDIDYYAFERICLSQLITAGERTLTLGMTFC